MKLMNDAGEKPLVHLEEIQETKKDVISFGQGLGRRLKVERLFKMTSITPLKEK